MNSDAKVVPGLGPRKVSISDAAAMIVKQTENPSAGVKHCLERKKECEDNGKDAEAKTWLAVARHIIKQWGLKRKIKASAAIVEQTQEAIQTVKAARVLGASRGFYQIVADLAAIAEDAAHERRMSELKSLETQRSKLDERIENLRSDVLESFVDILEDFEDAVGDGEADSDEFRALIVELRKSMQ